MEEVNPNIKCTVCGENEFEEREGFYYCKECGTKQEQVRHIEIETHDAFNDTATKSGHTKTMKIKVNVKAEKPRLTSWECYNYILRGYVEELLCFGAKEELKLMALQVWAAYLRRLEVAFFNKKQADLPRLGIRYLKSDAETLYNHSKQMRKNRKNKKRGDEMSCTSGEISARSWRSSKRKLDESIYSSITSATSTSINSNKAIKLSFNMKARKFFKKKMPLKHLARHALDSEGVLQCHEQPRVYELPQYEHEFMLMQIKQVYSVLAIALNLTGDNIQVTDLVRFIQEGHIGWKNVLQYFPENIACNAKELLKSVDFYKYPEKTTTSALRDHIFLFCKRIGIRTFQTPDMKVLVQRYVNELCLPPAIKVYAERMINYFPPQFERRAHSRYPSYEARAMAYIIFVLKLIFGLDGYKEKQMSEAAKKVNIKISELNSKSEATQQPLLFVWDEWVQYIELRKVIVSQFNRPFCRQFKQCESSSQILEQMAEDDRKQDEQEQTLNDNIDNNVVKQRYDNFKSMLETLIEKCRQTDESNGSKVATVPHAKIDFKATLTPALSYFKNVRLYCENYLKTNDNEALIQIPDMMNTDHSERNMQAYLEVKPLVEYFKNNGETLKVYSLDTTENRHYTGIYRAPRNIARIHGGGIHKACFDITDETWSKKVRTEVTTKTDDLAWKTDFEAYEDKYFQLRNKGLLKHIEGVPNFLEPLVTIQEFDSFNTEARTHFLKKRGVQQDPTCSIEVFSENNMDPLRTEDAIILPRRNLGKVDLFLDIENEDSLIKNRNIFDLHVNEDHVMKDSDTSKEASTQSHDTTTNPELEFLVSNMDCWMLMGNLSRLSRPQRAQLQEKFQPCFFWLMETCAQTLGIDWAEIYEQLLAIEIMFCMGIEDITDGGNCVYYKYLNPIKEYQSLVNTYRAIW